MGSTWKNGGLCKSVHLLNRQFAPKGYLYVFLLQAIITAGSEIKRTIEKVTSCHIRAAGGLGETVIVLLYS
jgi:hypothetical protein